jgi:predicted acetyltransferase
VDLDIHPFGPDEFDAVLRVDEAAFGNRPSPEEVTSWRKMCEYDRSLAVYDEGQMVATAGAFSFELTLPGLTLLPVAGVTMVAVRPTHRRRGLLRALMRRQIDDVRERGEAIAILTCSESAIYGRFGYGVATSTVNVEIDRRHGGFAQPRKLGGRVNLIDHEAALAVIPALYDRVRRLQPGAINRTPPGWGLLLQNPAGPVEGAGPRFYVTYESQPGQVDGAAHYRIRGQWNEGLSAGTLLLRELLAVTPEARAALWQYCLNVDLVQTVRAISRPVDEPLRWMLADPRRLRVTGLIDDLWVRLLNIPAALAARRYAAVGRVVFEVADPFCPENAGRYELDGGPDEAVCRRTDAPADVALDVADLGATYLGGVRFGTLARAGRVAELTPGALAQVDALFTCDPAPWCATPF